MFRKFALQWRYLGLHHGRSLETHGLHRLEYVDQPLGFQPLDHHAHGAEHSSPAHSPTAGRIHHRSITP